MCARYSLREMLHTLALSAESIADEQQEAKGITLCVGVFESDVFLCACG